MCDREASIMKWPWPTKGCRAIKKCDMNAECSSFLLTVSNTDPNVCKPSLLFDGAYGPRQR